MNQARFAPRFVLVIAMQGAAKPILFRPLGRRWPKDHHVLEGYARDVKRQQAHLSANKPEEARRIEELWALRELLLAAATKIKVEKKLRRLYGRPSQVRVQREILQEAEHAVEAYHRIVRAASDVRSDVQSGHHGRGD